MHKYLKPKQLYLFCALAIILEVLYVFLDLDSDILNTCLSIALFAINTLWVIFIVHESKIMKTIFGRLILILVSVIIIGFLFKLMHWLNANLILMIGYFGIMILYTIRFILKKQKHLLDILKLMWLEIGSLISLLILMHKIDRDYSFISSLLFFAVICVFTLDYNARINVKRQ